MRIERYDDVTAFYERVEPFLLEREAEHNLQLGFRSTLERDPHAWGTADPLLLAILDGESVVGVATRTPPYNLVLSVMAASAAEALAEELRDLGLPGVVAPVEAGAAFVAQSPAPAHVALEQRIFRAEAVDAPPPTTGSIRPYRESDRATAAGWLDAFVREALPGESGNGEELLQHRLEVGSALRLWDDGGPVSFLAYGSPTRNGMRIGPVYTPPELRGRGYASALTAAATEEILTTKRFAFLSTDLANPTSNAIYQRIGYRPVVDFNVWRFERA